MVESDHSALQDLKFKLWRSQAEHGTSQSWRFLYLRLDGEEKWCFLEEKGTNPELRNDRRYSKPVSH